MANIYQDPKQVKALRRRLGLLQRELGVMVYDLDAEIAQRNISKIERGEMAASASVRKSLARIAQTHENP